MKSVSELLTIEGAFSAKYLFTKLKTDYYLPTQIHNYRVEQQTLPVEFLLNCYRMLQDMNHFGHPNSLEIHIRGCK